MEPNLIINKKIEEILETLSKKEALDLIEKLVKRVKSLEDTDSHKLDFGDLYGTAKGLLKMDAQDYVRQSREDRIFS
jgi:hypothetical protein